MHQRYRSLVLFCVLILCGAFFSPTIALIVSGTGITVTNTGGAVTIALSTATQAKLPPAPATSGYFVVDTGSAYTSRAIAATDTPVFRNEFGDGSDGALTCSTTVTLTRVMLYSSATLNSSCDLRPSRFAIFVSGTLTINSGGKISSNGAAGPSSTAATQCVAPAVGTYGPGASGGYNATFQNDGFPTSNAGLSAGYFLGGNGGGGGTGGVAAGKTGGGTALTSRFGSNAVGLPVNMDFLMYGSTHTPAAGGSTIHYAIGGGGGGMGGQGSGGVGGSGACGGDIIGIFARAVVINSGGIIEAKGGTGASSSNANSGGGGGGGGGVIMIKALSYSNSGTLDVSGGAGGAGTGTGATGVTGSTGQTFIFTPAVP
jgi:hypothetical protein